MTSPTWVARMAEVIFDVLFEEILHVGIVGLSSGY